MIDIIKAIAQYGAVPVIVGVILYLLVFLRIKSSERKKREEDTALEQQRIDRENERDLERKKQDMERDLMMLEKMKELIHPQHTVEEQKKDLQTNNFIINQLGCLVSEGADRAYMFSFHNGGQDVLGRGLLKMSMTQETISENIVPIMSRYLNVPRTLFPTLYKELSEKDFYNVNNVDDIKKTDPFTYQFLVEHGARSSMFRAIKRNDGLLIGFIAMEYITRPCEDFKKAGKNIDKKVNRIFGALLGQEN